MKLSEVIAKALVTGMGDIEVQPVIVPSAPPVAASRVTDADGYVANAELGLYEDGVTQFASGEFLVHLKNLADAHAADPQYSRIEPRYYRYLVLRGKLHVEAEPGTLFPVEYKGQFDVPHSLAEFVEQNERAKYSGGGPSGQ